MATKGTVNVQTENIFPLIKKFLYSDHEIFLRELVSNASDAVDKLRFRSITEPELVEEGEQLCVQVIPNREAGTLTISDNGVGMTEEEMIQNLGTIAHSGSKAFIENLQKAAKAEASGDVSLIGQFGVGFYSAYLVADEVEVISKAAGQDGAIKWTSSADGQYTTEPGQREGRGTSVVLHLKEEQKELLDSWKLRNLIKRYSDYVSHPIELQVEREVGEGDEKTTELAFETVNQAKALWKRSSGDVTDEQYAEFYKHLTHDWEPPLAQTHFHIEGTQLFTGLLFVPTRPPFDLFDPDRRHGVRLYVKRVFIMDDCEELLPRWLRFMRGIIDSDDLPLNVSRELLQDSSITRTIRKQVIRKSLDLLEDMAENRPEDFKSFWDNYGVVLKEGLHFDPKFKNRVADLLRYASSHDAEALTSLKDYVERMPFAQKAIYYAMGPSRQVVEASPHLEAIKKKGYEILFMTDPIDQWAVQALTEYEEKKLVSVMTADLDLGDEEDEADKSEKEAVAEGFKGLTERFSTVLTDRVGQVRVSDRLTDSPVCLVIPEGGLHSHIERMLRANNQNVPGTRRIMEVNPSHALISNLKTLNEQKPESAQVSEWIEMLYDQALLAEGSPIDNPAAFASRMTRLMSQAVQSEVTTEA